MNKLQCLLILAILIIVILFFAYYNSNSSRTTMTGLRTSAMQVPDMTPNAPSATIVNYYATWCPYSNDFLPLWQQFERELSRKYPNVKSICKVCEGDVKYQCDAAGIQGYPTVVMYMGNRAVTFDAEKEGRTLLSLMNFVETTLGTKYF